MSYSVNSQRAYRPRSTPGRSFWPSSGLDKAGSEEDLHDRKSDPRDHTEWSTDYMPYKTYCVIVSLTVPGHGIDKIQTSLKNYSECLYITDLASVINFYINKHTIYNPRDHSNMPF